MMPGQSRNLIVTWEVLKFYFLQVTLPLKFLLLPRTTVMANSQVGAIDTIILKHAKQAFVDANKIKQQWQDLNFLEEPNLVGDFHNVALIPSLTNRSQDAAIKEYDDYANIIKQYVPHVHFLPQHADTTLDSIYAYDAAIATTKGLIKCNL